jgi:hypothetical protein
MLSLFTDLVRKDPTELVKQLMRHFNHTYIDQDIQQKTTLEVNEFCRPDLTPYWGVSCVVVIVYCSLSLAIEYPNTIGEFRDQRDNVRK